MVVNSKTPKVSIIIPTFNRGNRLRICLQSIKNQSFKDFEVIVCDDGSTDNTSDIINEFNEFLNINYIWDVNFGGPARPRNNGLKEAKGEIIAFLDSDDWWYPNKLEISIKHLIDCDMVHHNLDIYTSISNRIGVAKGRSLVGDHFKDLLINGNAIVNSSVLIRKSIIDKVGEFTEDKNLIAVEDFDYWIRVVRETNRIKYLNQNLGRYNVEDNISYSPNQIERQQRILEKYFPDLNDLDKKQALSKHFFNTARLYHTLGFYSDAKVYYKKVIISSNAKNSLKSCLGLFMCFFRIK